MVTKVAWRFPTQSFRRADTHVNINAKFPLFLSDFNKNSCWQQQVPATKYWQQNQDMFCDIR
jgi:hypothetical protein